MRYPRPFVTFLATGALCSIAGLAATQLTAGAAGLQQLAPQMSAFPAQSAVLSNTSPTVVTEGSPVLAAPAASVPEVTHAEEAQPGTAVALTAAAQATPPHPVTAPAADPVQSLPAGIETPIEVAAAPEQAAALLDAMNAARRREGRDELTRDSGLDAVAMVRARNLVTQGYFAHYGPDGESAFSELGARGITYGLAGENLARNNYPEARTVRAAFDGLMASPGHRANILEGRFTRVGVAAVRDGRVWVYVTVFMD